MFSFTYYVKICIESSSHNVQTRNIAWSCTTQSIQKRNCESTGSRDNFLSSGMTRRSFMSAHSYVLRQDSGKNIIYTRTH
jgi:hypothetical protein